MLYLTHNFSLVYFSTDNAEFFDISNEGNLVTVKLLNALSADDVVDKTLLTASVRASRANVGSGIASFAITTGTTTPVPLPVAPRFERTFYEASISRDNQFTYEVPTIVEATFSSLVDFQLDGGELLFLLTYVNCFYLTSICALIFYFYNCYQ